MKFLKLGLGMSLILCSGSAWAQMQKEIVVKQNDRPAGARFPLSNIGSILPQIDNQGSVAFSSRSASMSGIVEKAVWKKEGGSFHLILNNMNEIADRPGVYPKLAHYCNDASTSGFQLGLSKNGELAVVTPVYGNGIEATDCSVMPISYGFDTKVILNSGVGTRTLVDAGDDFAGVSGDEIRIFSLSGPNYRRGFSSGLADALFLTIPTIPFDPQGSSTITSYKEGVVSLDGTDKRQKIESGVTLLNADHLTVEENSLSFPGAINSPNGEHALTFINVRDSRDGLVKRALIKSRWSEPGLYNLVHLEGEPSVVQSSLSSSATNIPLPDYHPMRATLLNSGDAILGYQSTQGRNDIEYQVIAQLGADGSYQLSLPTAFTNRADHPGSFFRPSWAYAQPIKATANGFLITGEEAAPIAGWPASSGFNETLRYGLVEYRMDGSVRWIDEVADLGSIPFVPLAVNSSNSVLYLSQTPNDERLKLFHADTGESEDVIRLSSRVEIDGRTFLVRRDLGASNYQLGKISRAVLAANNAIVMASTLQEVNSSGVNIGSPFWAVIGRGTDRVLHLMTDLDVTDNSVTYRAKRIALSSDSAQSVLSDAAINDQSQLVFYARLTNSQTLATTTGIVKVGLNAVAAICPADFNNSGAVTNQDLFAFLAAFHGQQNSADFNGNGSVTLQDLFDFLGAYFRGCQ